MNSTRVTLASFETDYTAIRDVRLAVFVEEQQVPIDIELDDRDRHCVHVLAHDSANRPIGTGRIDLDAGGKIGRVAVLSEARGMGVGTALMESLHVIAQSTALTTVWCHAQRSAVPFYLRLGYLVTTEPFLEAGIEHVGMQCQIRATDSGARS